MDSILSQAPENTDLEICKELMEKHNGNVASILAELWKIAEEPVKPKNKWEEMRDLCNDYEDAMQEFMKNKQTEKQ